MKCVLKVDKGKWVCEPEVTPELEVYNPIVIKAINAFHQRFYPDEEHPADWPWEMHIAAGDKTAKINALRQQYLKRHDLTWHWKLLLPCLKLFKAEPTKKIVLNVSQIRQWQLVSCFWVSPKSQAQQEPDWSRKSDTLEFLKNANKELVRQPIFGKSHRITRWEVYAALNDPIIVKEIKTAVENTHDGKDPIRLAHVLGRHDCYIIVKSVTAKGEGYEIELEQYYDIEPEQAALSLADGVIVEEPCRPYGGSELPLFSETRLAPHTTTKIKPKPSIKTAAPAISSIPRSTEAVLFSSDNYCRAFAQLSDVLNDASAKAVLIIAPPGSGKENLSNTLHKCRETAGQLVTVSLAGMDEKTAAHQLFNCHRPNDCPISKRLEPMPDGRVKPGNDFVVDVEDGALFKALGGTLVIDELDKAEPATRGMLLRLLENDEIAIPGTASVVCVKDCRPLFVFAGSKTRKDFLLLGPVDFWSRITHIVEMLHPLELGEEAERKRVAQDYIRLFWLMNIRANVGSSRLLCDGNMPLYKVQQKIFASGFCELAGRVFGDFVAREIAEIVCGPGQPLPSIRTIRGTVSRCFNLIFNAIFYSRSPDAALQQVVFSEAANSIDLSFVALDKANTPVQHKALEELRGLIRASATIQI